MYGERITLQPSKSVNEQGFILIVTMLVLVVLTIVCIGALDNSTFEVQIAANDRQSRVAFNLADGGVELAGKLVGETLKDTANPIHANLSYENIANPDYEPTEPVGPTNLAIFLNTPVSGQDLFYRRVMDYSPPSPAANNEFDFLLTDPNVQGDIVGRITDRFAEVNDGSSHVFANGAAGAGGGSTGSTSIVFDIDVDSYSARNSNSKLAVRYRDILGVATP